MATHNADIIVNIYSESQSVDVASFGRFVHATDDVETTFTDLYRIYTSNSDASQDDDLAAGGKAAAAAFFSQPNRPKDFAIAPVDYEDVGGELTTSLDALLAAWGQFYGICCMSRAAEDQEALAAWAQANERLASGQSSTATILGGTAGNEFETMSAAAYTRAFGSFHPDDTEFVDLDWLTTILSANPDNQSSVAFDKLLVGPTPATNTEVNATELAQIKTYNGNIYLPFYGPAVMRPGTLWSGKSIEDQILDDWFKARIQEAVAALAIRKSNANSKVDFDDFGIGEAEAEIRGVYDLGVGTGAFVANTLVCTPPKYASLTSTQIASQTVVIPITLRKKVGLKIYTLNVGITF